MKALKYIIFAAATSLAGCGHVKSLEAQVESLNSELADTQLQLSDTCRLTREIAMGGLVFYLGEDVWFNAMSGEMVELNDTDELCAKSVDQLRELLRVDPRASMLKAYKKARPPVEE